jgi:hypothetical protein
MHVREFIDLAVFVAAQGPVLVNSVRQVPTSALAQYWTVSKCRLDRWNRALRGVQLPAASRHGDLAAADLSLQAVCEEILVSEMLTRVWSSILTALDYAAGSSEAQPVAASVLAGHVDASNRVLGLISYKPQGPGSENNLNRLRRLTERWTDLLLGSLGLLAHAAPFAHDAARAEEFARDFDCSWQPRVRLKAWNLIAASLRATFEAHLHGVTANADLNSSIAGAILVCFPAQLFDATGVYHSLWNLRLSSVASDTQVMVDQLLAADSPSEVQPGLFSPIDRNLEGRNSKFR